MARRKLRQSPDSSARTITIGVDGRLYWHEVTPEMLEVASALCPTDPALQRRLAAIPKKKDGQHDHHDADRA